jgi:hypothetical protein
MTGEDLRQALAIKGGAITIGIGTLTADIDAMLRAAYGGKPLRIHDASPGTTDGNAVVITGRAGFLATPDNPGLPVLARFSADGHGNVQAVVRHAVIGGDAPAGWTFSQSIPGLPSVVSDAAADGQAVPLDRLNFAEACFLVASHDGGNAEYGIDLVPGINFAGRLTPSPLMGLFRTLVLGEQDTVIISGPVRLPDALPQLPALAADQYAWNGASDVPGINLRAGIGKTLGLAQTISFEASDFRIYSPPSHAWLNANPTYRPTAAFTGKIRAGIAVDIAAEPHADTSAATLTGTFTGASLENLTKLAGFTGIGSLADSLPNELKDIGDLQLESARVDVATIDGHLRVIGTSATIGMPNTVWHLWTDSDRFDVEGLYARFDVARPFDQPWVEITVGGRIAISYTDDAGAEQRVPIDVRAEGYRNQKGVTDGGYTVYAELAQAQTIPFTHLMKSYGEGIPPPGGLTLDSLAIVIAPKTYYSFAMTLAQEQPWVIPVGPTQLAISDVSLSLLYYPAIGKPTASMGLTIAIGSVPIQLFGKMDSESDATVYTFGGCVQGVDLNLARFIGYVGRQFGVDSALPPELALDAAFDYIAGRVVRTQKTGAPTTTLSAAGKFDLTIGSVTIPLSFFADTHMGSPVKGSNPYVIGVGFEKPLAFSSLPLVGRIPELNEFALTNLGFTYTNVDPAENAVSFAIPKVTESVPPAGGDGNLKPSKSYAIDPDNAQLLSVAHKGFSLTASLNRGDAVVKTFALPLSLPPAEEPKAHLTPAPAGTAVTAAAAAVAPMPRTSPADQPVHWIDIHKSFGPVDLQRIGLAYSGGEATFAFSAGFTVGGFTLDLQGLAITFPLPLPGESAGHSVSFDLNGLALGLSRGGLTLGGAFLKAKDANGTTSYFGEILAQTATFGFKAMGGYTPEHGKDPASFFIYANIDVPLGGPPFLFITGLAAGFGINRVLQLPTLEELPTYWLLPKNAPAQKASPQETIVAALPALQEFMPEKPGEYWVAAGLTFTSFEMVDAFALITISFGVDMQIGLLGSAAMTFPKGSGSSAIAYAEIDIVASVTPSTGLMAVQGKLSPASFIYGGYCQIAGGFAYELWFDGDHKGDFVITYGGYSPFLHDTDPYPPVPRLSISYGLGPFQAYGQAYFALTPAMMMAGMTLSATWSSGPVDAWVDAGIDILLAWAPFHYEAHGYVHIGCSVDMGLFTIRVHAGADLYIWGPSFGGTASVDLDVVSFDINFGADRLPPPPVGWATFKDNFLPKNTKTASPTARAAAHLPRGAMPHAAADAPEKVNIIKASFSEGLLKQNVVAADGRHFDWVVDPEHFVLLTDSTIPANNGEWQLDPDKQLAAQKAALSDALSAYNATLDAFDPKKGPYLVWPAGAKGYSETQVWNPTLNIAAMHQNNMQSYHTVSVALQADGEHVTELSVEPILNHSSAALWGAYKAQQNADDDRLLKNTLTGFRITPIPRHPRKTRSVPLLVLVFQPGYATGFTLQQQAVDTRYAVHSTRQTVKDKDTLTMNVSGAHTGQIENEDYVLRALQDDWVAQQRGVLLDELAGHFPTHAGAGVRLATLAGKKALVDWPVVELLGADLPAAA